MTRNNNLSWEVSPPKPPTLGKKEGGRASGCPLAPPGGDYQRLSPVYRDSALLDDPDGLAKIKAEYGLGT